MALSDFSRHPLTLGPVLVVAAAYGVTRRQQR